MIVGHDFGKVKMMTEETKKDLVRSVDLGAIFSNRQVDLKAILGDHTRAVDEGALADAVNDFNPGFEAKLETDSIEGEEGRRA